MSNQLTVIMPNTEREAIDALQKEISMAPQAPAMSTEHFFAGGMYCRRIEIPQGSLIVSKVHKTEHFFIGCEGELLVAGQGEPFTVMPGDIIPSAIGTKRAVFALTDVVVLTVHRTDKTGLEGLEEEIIEVDGNYMYDINNIPKEGVLVGMLNDYLENIK